MEFGDHFNNENKSIGKKIFIIDDSSDLGNEKYTKKEHFWEGIGERHNTFAWRR